MCLCCKTSKFKMTQPLLTDWKQGPKQDLNLRPPKRNVWLLYPLSYLVIHRLHKVIQIMSASIILTISMLGKNSLFLQKIGFS